MGDYLSETESDTSSVMGDSSSVDGVSMKPPSPAPREQLQKRIESLLQENRVLKVELETYKLRVRTLQEENKSLKQASVLIQAKAEQEEEFISNTLLKKIKELQKEKEVLALNYEQEEECLTNDLSRKLNQLRSEKAQLTATLQQEQESLVNKLMRKIRKLESETVAKQNHLDQLRREKVELENTLEQEQEALVNRLWKRMDKLEAEKRCLQEKLEQPVSAPPSPMDVSNGGASPAQSHSGMVSQSEPNQSGVNRHTIGRRPTDASTLVKHINSLRGEVVRLKEQLKNAQDEHTAMTAKCAKEEQMVREENLRLRRKLEMEVERRLELCRHLSESESSLEMEDERHFNELSMQGQIPAPPASATANIASVPSVGGNLGPVSRGRTISSPIQHSARPISPAMGSLNVNVNMVTGMGYSPPSPMNHRCNACGSLLPHQLLSAPVNHTGISALPPGVALSQAQHGLIRTKSGSEKFARPANPPTPKAASPAPSPSSSSSVQQQSGVAEEAVGEMQDTSSRKSS